MKVYNLEEFQSQFSSVLDLVRKGESVSLSYDKNKKPLAVLVPYSEYKKQLGIKLGTFEGKAHVEFADDFKMSDEEFLA